MPKSLKEKGCQFKKKITERRGYHASHNTPRTRLRGLCEASITAAEVPSVSSSGLGVSIETKPYAFVFNFHKCSLSRCHPDGLPINTAGPLVLSASCNIKDTSLNSYDMIDPPSIRYTVQDFGIFQAKGSMVSGGGSEHLSKTVLPYPFFRRHA